MNESQFDQFLQRLNYLSRWTLASPSSYRTRSPLLPNTSSYNHSMRPSFNLQKSYKSKKNERQKRKSLEASESSKLVDEFILIEQLDRQIDGQDEEQQQRQCQDSPFIIMHQISSSQIRIQEDSQQSCSSHEEHEANQQLNQSPQDSKNFQISRQAEFHQSQRLHQQRQRQSDFPILKTGAKQIVIQDSGLFEQENLPTMNRNYTFGSSLDDSRQFNNSRKNQQISTSFQYQSPAPAQKSTSVCQEKWQAESRQKKPQLELLLDDSNNETLGFSQIISPKFNMPFISQQGTAINQSTDQRQHSNLNTVKKTKRTPKKSYQTTSPKKSSSSTKKREKKIRAQNNEKFFHPLIYIEVDQSLRSKENLQKYKPFSNSILKIENIMRILPNNLKQTYQSIKQHLIERQDFTCRQLKDQQKQMKVLRLLIQSKKKGLSIDSYLLCQKNQNQEHIMLNQIKLKVAIRQVVRKRNCF